MNREKLEKSIHAVFSDTLMIFLAVLVIPLLLVRFAELNMAQKIIVDVIDWFIYGMFFLEFVMKVGVAQERRAYLKDNRLDSVISIIIIISPMFELITIYFSAVYLLRLLKISRLVRLGGVLGKTNKGWKNVELKSYLIVIIITSAGIILSFFKPTDLSEESEGALSIFISVIGIIYAIIAAFMIVNVWQEYDNLENLLRKETVSLRNVYVIAGHLDSEITSLHLRRGILEYIDTVKEAYWKEVRDPNEISYKLTEIIDSIKLFNPKNGREEVILNNIYSEIRETSNSRINIDTLVEEKTPKILWVLLIILSVIVFVGFYLVDFGYQEISTLTITMVATATSVVIVIIYDIDYPFRPGFWRITPEPYEGLENYLTKRSLTGDEPAISKST